MAKPAGPDEAQAVRRSPTPPGTTLTTLVEGAGHRPDPRLADLDGLMGAAQERRLEREATRTDLVTRSTGLWCLLFLDTSLRAQLRQAGLDLTAWGALLGLDGPPPGPDGRPGPLHDSFATAMRAYLSDRPRTTPVGIAEVALVVLQSSTADPGMIGKRLERLGVDVAAALRSVVVELTPRTSAPEAEPADVSVSVRSIRDYLGRDKPVPASTLVEELQARHGEYASGWEHVPVRATTQENTVDQWLEAVSELYDPQRVARTRHRVLDGQLLLLGLAELEPSVAQDLLADGLLDRLRESAEVLPRRVTIDQTTWTPDGPAKVDRLGRKKLAEALVTRLRRLAGPDASDDSFMVHVDGPWGAGKSSFFAFLSDELTRDDAAAHGEGPSFLVVKVNAWREQRVGLQWWTLLGALRSAIVRDAPLHRRPGLLVSMTWHRIRAAWVPFLAAVLLLAGALVWMFGIAKFDLLAGGETAASMAKIVGLVPAAIGGVLGVSQLVAPLSRRSAQGFEQKSSDPMEHLSQLFGKTLRRSRKPVVFLVDDLDRCDADYVVAFLEAMQTLVRDAPRPRRLRDRLLRRDSVRRPGPYAFVAADGQWIRRSFEQKYDAFTATGLPGRPLGYLFLEKVFQLHVRLPTMTAVARNAMLASLLTPDLSPRTAVQQQAELTANAQADVRKAASEAELIEAGHKARRISNPETRMKVLGDIALRFSDKPIEDRVEHALGRFGGFLEANPRTLRLFVNAYGVLRQLRTLEEILVSPDALALWTVIEIRWPCLAAYLREHPDAVDEAPADAPEEIRALLVSKHVRAVLDDPRSGGLDADQVRQCAGVMD